MQSTGSSKPRVERTVPFVRASFFAGESFIDLADAQARAEQWCRSRAGLRTHGTTGRRPAEVFGLEEAPVLLPAPLMPYDLPVYARPKVHRDHHIEVAKALYSVPGNLVGRHVEVRADRALVKVYCRSVLVKTHPRQGPGRRSTDPADSPSEKSAYAMRDLARLQAMAASYGPAIGGYAQAVLDDPLPWRKMRQVYALLGPVKNSAGMGHAEFLELVLSDEVTRRETTSAAIRARGAGLDPDMCLENWDPPAKVSFDHQVWDELCSLRFVDAGHNALITPTTEPGSRHRRYPGRPGGHTRLKRARGQGRLPATNPDSPRSEVRTDGQVGLLRPNI